MSTESNVFSQGGGGTRFEFDTQTAFMVMMLIGAFIPGGEEDRIIRLRQQSGGIRTLVEPEANAGTSV